MKNTIASCLLVFLVSACFSQSNDELQIRKILEKQTSSWNSGNIDEFMTTYWNSDSLQFVGSTGITSGYASTRDRYKTKYPDTAHMGKLFFDIISYKRLSAEYYFVIGKWQLKRSVGDAAGIFSLLFRKINSKWVIIVDHSS